MVLQTYEDGGHKRKRLMTSEKLGIKPYYGAKTILKKATYEDGGHKRKRLMTSEKLGIKPSYGAERS
jgi:hypothetical protein